IKGFEGLPSPFQGVLRMSTNSFGLYAIGLRTRYNERGDFLITTTMPIAETGSFQTTTTDLIFPHLADGGGFTTQFIFFNSGSSAQPAEGTLQLSRQNGEGLDVTLK